MLTPEIKSKLSKIYELVKRGGTEGEKNAARIALDKIIDKHNLDGIDLEGLDKEHHYFKYSSYMEEQLLIRIVIMMLDDSDGIIRDAGKQTSGVRQIRFTLKYLDYITLSCAYEYFRRHMKKQWLLLCADQLKKKKKAKTRNVRRAELQRIFFSQYVIASALYKDDELEEVKFTKKDQNDYINIVTQIEGGKYNTQVTNGLLLN